ncbi:MAG TPA: hypothetical protein VIF64_19935 [Pyrinomonadaceae bacterium]
MLTETFRSIISAARKVFTNWRAMFLLATVYASLLVALYFFVAVREASIVQVILTFALAIVTPLLFFVLQSMVASQTDGVTAGSLLKRSLTSFWKLILISLPLIALAVLIAYLLAKAQSHVGASLNETADLPHQIVTRAGAQPPARPINWKIALLSTVRYLAFGLVLPLAAIHLWLATVHEGLGTAVRRAGTHLARAFAPQSVLIYIAGFVVFGVIPYFLLFKATPTNHAWLEVSLLVARLVAVFALTLFGWVITVRALGQSSSNPALNRANEAT